jgi:hypothetical protein
MGHIYTKKGQPLCGDEQNQNCKCDRIQKDEIRTNFGLPALTDAEYEELRSKSESAGTRKMLVAISK